MERKKGVLQDKDNLQDILAFKEKVKDFELEIPRFRAARDYTEDLSMRKNFLLCAGFSEEQINKMVVHRRTLYPVHSLYGDIVGLLSVGITNYQKVMSDNTRIITWEDSFIQTRFDEIKKMGFSDKQTIRVITNYSGVLTYDILSLKKKILDLEKIGLKNVRKLIAENSNIWSRDTNTIKGLKSQLESWGFSNPIKILENDMTLGVENMDGKRKLIENICQECNSTNNYVEIIENSPNIFSSKYEKIEIIGEMVKDMCPEDRDINHIIHRMVFLNIEDLMISFSQRNKDDQLLEVINRAKLISKVGLAKDAKIGFIKNNYGDLSKLGTVDEIIFELYKKGYLNEKNKKNGN